MSDLPDATVRAAARVLLYEWQAVQAEFMTLDDMAAHIARKMLAAARPVLARDAATAERERIAGLIRSRADRLSMPQASFTVSELRLVADLLEEDDDDQ